MIKAVIFDLDGTLLNTLPDIHAVLNNSLKKFNLPQINYKSTAQFVGNGARKLVERAVEGREMFEKVYADYILNFSECKNERTRLFDGEAAFLSELKSSGIYHAILSNKPQLATDHVYDKFLSKFDFNIVLGQTEYFPLKPDPASTLAIIEKSGVNKEDCVFVGDGETDIQTASAAGIKCISALWGYRSKDQLKRAGASLFAKNFDELKKIIFNDFYSKNSIEI